MTEFDCHPFRAIKQVLVERLAQAPAQPAPVQVLTGPRQVGKTTLLLELANAWADQAIYAAADTPEAALSGWWESVWQRATRLTNRGPVLVLIDEIQYLSGWQRLLKSEFDRIKRHHLPIQAVVTGSSALSLGRGTRETMAGRFERLRFLHWTAESLVTEFNWDRATAAEEIVKRGCYPGGISLLADPRRWQAYVRDSIIEPAIGRDLLAIEQVRKPALLRQVFSVAAGHPAEIFSLQKLRGQLADPGALETVAHYLHLLEEACLVAALPKYSGKMVRRRASPPKLVVLNNAILAALAGDDGPGATTQPERWGRWVENACLAFAWNSGQELHYWREEPLEVDLVMEGSWGRWAVEIKTGGYQRRDLAGLLEFCRRYPRFRPLFVADAEGLAVARAAGVAAVSWNEFLMTGVGQAS